MAKVIAAQVTQSAVDVNALAQAVGDAGAGATVTFAGVVRNHDGGRAVDRLEYSAHPIAPQVVEEIAAEISARPGLRALAIVHRVGNLAIGDVALGVAVSADHRREAFAACADAVDLVKAKLPVWKLQAYSDGSQEWSNCP